MRSRIVAALISDYGITEEMARGYAVIEDYNQYVYILESYGGMANDSNN